jgi:hypothetical protein
MRERTDATATRTEATLAGFVLVVALAAATAPPARHRRDDWGAFVPAARTCSRRFHQDQLEFQDCATRPARWRWWARRHPNSAPPKSPSSAIPLGAAAGELHAGIRACCASPQLRDGRAGFRGMSPGRPRLRVRALAPSGRENQGGAMDGGRLRDISMVMPEGSGNCGAAGEIGLRWMAPRSSSHQRPSGRQHPEPASCAAGRFGVYLGGVEPAQWWCIWSAERGNRSGEPGRSVQRWFAGDSVASGITITPGSAAVVSWA